MVKNIIKEVRRDPDAKGTFKCAVFRRHWKKPEEVEIIDHNPRIQQLLVRYSQKALTDLAI